MSLFHKLIFKIGCRLRNPSYSRIFDELKKSEFFTQQQLDTIQHDKLQALLVFAYTHSQFYRQAFDAIAYNPVQHYAGVSDLQKLPLLEKTSLLNNHNLVETTAGYQFNKLFYSETSGSTGEPLVFYRNEEWDSCHRASVNRGLSWFDVKPYDKAAYFWGYSFNLSKTLKVRLVDWFMNRKRLFSYSDNELKKFILKNREIKLLHGYSSMIYEIAKKCQSMGISFNNLALIKGTSEKIYPYYSDATNKAFGKPIISEYGAAETGIIAFECPEGNMHINEETCIFENVAGEAVVTNLYSYSLPIIRYRLGDQIEMSAEKCKCGRQHRIIKEVTGRIGKNIIGKEGEKYPSLTMYYIFKNIAIKNNVLINYKAYQNRPGELVIHIEDKLTDELCKLITENCHEYFLDTIVITILGEQILHDHTKKKTDFETTLSEQ